ncbi:DUF2850 domain-containing protein [Vibrio sp. S4M6]|uniref:DUF2850 domain-containing protein n=1 Tax=Vibrio sinus TaxID=2946865 RepID=UPI00202A1926|nr:DUF2850 domain-containing protein [Vibrio sinus]MCL9781981.1 DUF2850 domain-containing protein [Vibrio sinus]
MFYSSTTHQSAKRSAGVASVTMLKITLALLLVVLFIITVSLAHKIMHRNKIDHKHVYGLWIEVGTPSYDTEVIKINEVGVYKNSHLITTHFDFNGTELEINTGKGRTVYALDKDDPNILKRTQPRLPQQQLVRKGYEDTAELDVSSYVRKKKVVRYIEEDEPHPVDSQMKKLEQVKLQQQDVPVSGYRGK